MSTTQRKSISKTLTYTVLIERDEVEAIIRKEIGAPYNADVEFESYWTEARITWSTKEDEDVQS